MKKRNRILLRIVKWSLIIGVGYWFLTMLIFGHTDFDSRKGIINYGWSGLDALFTKDEFGFFKNEKYKIYLDGVDGPYILHDTIFSVNDSNLLIKTPLDRTELITSVVANTDRDSFQFSLKEAHQQEPEFYDLPAKLIAISDIEGNFNAFHSFLINNKVIDENYNWIYGNGHLVLNGDFFDRGEDVTQVLWLIYLLEEKAEKHGGKVHFIIGNHEVMNLSGDISYAEYKYIEIARQISREAHWDKATRHLYSEQSEIGKWLRSKNVIEKIGKYLFVHAGLSPKLIAENLDIPSINRISKKYYGEVVRKKPEDKKESLVLSSYYSPYWYRGLCMSFTYKMLFFLSDPSNAPIEKTSETELNDVLKFYEAEKIVIGHSVVNEVTTDYHKKVIKIDVKHGLEKNSSKTQGILIENEIEYSVNGLGERKRL